MSTDSGKPSKSKIPFILVLVIALTGGFFIALWQGESTTRTSVFPVYTDVGGNFELTGGGGKRVHLKDFKGQLVILLFGYTHCPDACPTSLFTLKNSMQVIGNNSDQVQVIMVTIDPNRDNAEHMHKYVTYFDPSFIGLSGTKQEIDKVVKLFRGQYEQGQELPDSGYLMRHTTFIYLIDRKGKVRKLHNEKSTAEELAKDINLQIQQS